MKMHEYFPPIVRQLFWTYNASIIGSFAKAVYEDTDLKACRDIDIVVPLSNWRDAAFLLAGTNCKVNDFGGWEVDFDGLKVDIWPGDIWLCGVLFHKEVYIYSPSTDKISKIIKRG